MRGRARFAARDGVAGREGKGGEGGGTGSVLDFPRVHFNRKFYYLHAHGYIRCLYTRYILGTFDGSMIEYASTMD